MRRIPDSGTTGIAGEEWLQALAEASRRNDKGMTTGELQERLGWSLEKTRRMIARAAEKGLVSRGKRTREGIDGRMFASTVYLIRNPMPSKNKRK